MVFLALAASSVGVGSGRRVHQLASRRGSWEFSIFSRTCVPGFPPALKSKHGCRRIRIQPAASRRDDGNGATPSPTSEQLPTSSAPTVVSDKSVPEGHQGLHGFLYGEGGAEAHDAASASYNFREGEDDGSTLVPVPAYLSAREGESAVGVYALHDHKRNLQYVGYSRNLVLAIKGHRSRVGEERCAFARVMVFANKAMQSKALLEREAANWVKEAGTLPPGNGVEQDEWDGTAFDPALLTPEQRELYEEKKLKLRKAMGENLHDGVEGESDDAKTRRLKLIQAVEGDNWSEVIGGQTEAALGTAEGAAGADKAQQAQQQVVTPFARARVHRSVGEGPKGGVDASAPLTIEAVDRVLDDVRPYLIADGGNVDVVDVEGGVVKLQLQGACGTCPSSSATMKMGIERALKGAFGDKIVDVMQVGAPDTAASVPAVDMHLNMIRGAITSLGGSVDVLSVEGGVCKLRYQGPAPIGSGVKAAVKDKFPDITEVVFVDE